MTEQKTNWAGTRTGSGIQGGDDGDGRSEWDAGLVNAPRRGVVVVPPVDSTVKSLD